MGRTLGLASFLWIASVLLAPAAWAGICGGDVACRCGDTLRGATTLQEDLTDCPGDGLRLVGASRLDCAGRAIVGGTGGRGVVLDRTQGAAVRNCRIEGFRTGVRIRGGGAGLVAGNEIVDSRRYGIELARGTRENLLVLNLVRNSGDEGIHIGTGSDGTRVLGNEIVGSGAEGIYVLSSHGGLFAANLVSEGGAAALYVKHSSDNVFAANDVHGRNVHVRGHSRRNLFQENHVEKGRFVFEAYREQEHPSAVQGWTSPGENRVVGGAVLDTANCFHFKGASDNEVVDVAANGCRARTETARGGRPAARNVVTLVEWPT